MTVGRTVLLQLCPHQSSELDVDPVPAVEFTHITKGGVILPDGRKADRQLLTVKFNIQML